MHFRTVTGSTYSSGVGMLTTMIPTILLTDYSTHALVYIEHTSRHQMGIKFWKRHAPKAVRVFVHPFIESTKTSCRKREWCCRFSTMSIIDSPMQRLLA